MIACAVAGGTIVMGTNNFKTSPDSKARGNRVHCEHDVIKQLAPGTKHVKLYIFRERADQSPGNARPCESCFDLIKQAGISRICYTTDKGFANEKVLI